MKQQPRSSPRSARNQRTVSIIGTGSYTPEKILTNEDLSRMVDTSDEWITTRTGIKERRVAAKDETTSDMAAKAALKAIEQAEISPEEIDLLLVATATPDMIFPATACFVQKKIGAKNAACLDVSAACAGFLFGVEIAQQFITSGTYDTALVIGADKLASRCWVIGAAPTASLAPTWEATVNIPTSCSCRVGDQRRRSRPRTRICICKRSTCQVRKSINKP